MLHLSLIVPRERTDEVLALVESTVGCTNVVLLPGAAREPRGDLVTVDVAREAGDGLLEELRGAGIGECGSVTVESIDLSMSRRADDAERRAPGEGADAVLWEQLEDTVEGESTLSFTYFAFLTLATMIAACGVLLDNAVLVVGAMAVGPEFGPLAGLCTALVRRTARLGGRSAVALLAGFAVAMALTTVFSLVMDAGGLFAQDMLERDRPNTGFIWQPDMFSFVVAVLAGTAGTLSLTSSKAGALVGVAISVTTVPAAANAAVALSYGDLTQVRGSSVQLVLNLVGIVLAGTLTLLAQKVWWDRRQKRGAGRVRGT